MTTINISDKYRVQYDGQQYMPEVFDKGGVEIKVGASKGQLSKAKWKHAGKYYGKLEHSVIWCVDNGASELGEMTMFEFIHEYKQMRNQFIDAVTLSN